MRIFTKKAYRFVNPEMGKVNLNRPNVSGKNIFIETSTLGFHDVPGWVENDLQFKRGVESGNIEVIDTKAKEKLAESEKNTLDVNRPQRKPRQKIAG
jgi:hypothetical protein